MRDSNEVNDPTINRFPDLTNEEIETLFAYMQKHWSFTLDYVADCVHPPVVATEAWLRAHPTDTSYNRLTNNMLMYAMMLRIFTQGEDTEGGSYSDFPDWVVALYRRAQACEDWSDDNENLYQGASALIY